MDVALTPLRNQGMQILNLNDWLILAQSGTEILSHRAAPLRHMKNLSLMVNWTKSSLLSSQSISFLGIKLDSLAMKERLSIVCVKTFQRMLGYMAPAAAGLQLRLLTLAGRSCATQSMEVRLRADQSDSELHHSSAALVSCQLVRLNGMCSLNGALTKTWTHEGVGFRGCLVYFKSCWIREGPLPHSKSMWQPLQHSQNRCSILRIELTWPINRQEQACHPLPKSTPIQSSCYAAFLAKRKLTSLRHRSFSKNEDVLAQTWPSLPYAFPLVSLLPQVINRYRETRHSVLLVAP